MGKPIQVLLKILDQLHFLISWNEQMDIRCIASIN
jgi:hypothetical protein